MKALTFIKLVAALIPHVDMAVVGGAARDIYYGRKPADLDCAVVTEPTVPEDEHEGAVFSMMSEISYTAGMYGIRSEVMQAYHQVVSEEGVARRVDAEDFSKRLYGNVKVHCEDFAVDFLFTRSVSVLSMCHTFDCNFNMFIAGPELLAADYVGPKTMPHPDKELAFNEHIGMGHHRRSYMVAKHSEYLAGK